MQIPTLEVRKEVGSAPGPRPWVMSVCSVGHCRGGEGRKELQGKEGEAGDQPWLESHARTGTSWKYM